MDVFLMVCMQEFFDEILSGVEFMTKADVVYLSIVIWWFCQQGQRLLFPARDEGS